MAVDIEAARRAVANRFNAIHRLEHERYRRTFRRNEARRIKAMENIETSESFAEWMIETYGDERDKQQARSGVPGGVLSDVRAVVASGGHDETRMPDDRGRPEL